MLGILLSLWQASPTEPPSPSKDRLLSEKRPLVVELNGKSLKVIDAMQGSVTLSLDLPEIRTSIPPEITAKWHDWPAASLRDDSRRKSSLTSARLQFHFDEDFVQIEQSSAGGKLHLFVDLQTGKRCSYTQTASPRNERIVFERVDDVIAVILTPEGDEYKRMSTDLKSGLAHPAQYVQVIDAISVHGGGATISEDQKLRAMTQFGRRILTPKPFWLAPKASPIHLYGVESKLGREGIEQIRDEEEARGRVYSADGNWLYVRFDNDADSASDLVSWYWKVDPKTDEAQRIAWPFGLADAFRPDEFQESGAPVIFGVHTSLAGESLGASERRVLWNLETGQVAELPADVMNCRRFDRRLLLDFGDAIAWYDLDRDALEYVKGWKRASAFLPAWLADWRSIYPLGITLGWIAIWLALVRPIRTGDVSRPFGALFMFLAASALSLNGLRGFGIVIAAPIAEWTICMVLVAALLILVFAVTVQRGASWFLLATAWSITLGLTISLAQLGGTEVYNQIGYQAQPGIPSAGPIYSAFWSHLTSPDYEDNYSPSGETQLTPWRRFGKDPPVKFVAEGKPALARALWP